MATDLFKGHSASWIAGYKEGNLSGQEYQRLADQTAIWLLEQDRIDHEMWVWTQGVIVGCLLVIATYFIGRAA